MFRFFRSSKLQQPGEGRTARFWISSLAEFLLVVVGILAALQIENWNHFRQ
ncbi:MAG: hypothetical protein KAT15_26480 [Bacteroidales bacterium]|nr:hypothetical protein [Bacteroidales bacterium]